MINTTLKQLVFSLTFGVFCAPLSASFLPTGHLAPAPIADVQLGADEISIIGVAKYANGCYSPWTNIKDKKDQTIVLSHIARYRSSDFCNEAIEYQKILLPIKNLEEGTYQIVDGSDGKNIATLEVSDAGAETTWPSTHHPSPVRFKDILKKK